MLIVIASMEQELAGLRKQLRRGWRPGGDQADGKEPLPLELRVIGMGEQAGADLSSLLETSNGPSSGGLNRPAGLLLLGVAGAVDPGLETGDLVLSSRYYRPHLDENSPLISSEREAPDSANPIEIPATLQDKSETTTDFLAPDPGFWGMGNCGGQRYG